MHDCCFYRIIYISGNTKILEPNFQPNQHLFRSAFALNVTCTFSVFCARFHLSLSRLWFISICDVDLFTKIIRLKFWIISGYFCININNLPCANQSVHQMDGYNGVIEIEKRNRFDEAFFFWQIVLMWRKRCWNRSYKVHTLTGCVYRNRASSEIPKHYYMAAMLLTMALDSIQVNRTRLEVTNDQKWHMNHFNVFFSLYSFKPIYQTKFATNKFEYCLHGSTYVNIFRNIWFPRYFIS